MPLCLKHALTLPPFHLGYIDSSYNNYPPIDNDQQHDGKPNRKAEAISLCLRYVLNRLLFASGDIEHHATGADKETHIDYYSSHGYVD